MAAPDAAPAPVAVKSIKGEKKKVHKDATADLYAQHAPKTPDDAMRAIWHKPSEIRRHERELFKRFASDVKPRETMGLAPKHAPLSNCYGWTQSRDFVIVVVWLQGSPDDVTVEINNNKMLVQTEGYTPVIDRQLFSQVDERVDVESVSWDKLDLMALKLTKRDPGVIWDALFAGDWRLLRAVDAASYEALPDPSAPLTYTISVFVPEHCLRSDIDVDVTAQYVSVRVREWTEWRRHFKYPCRATEAVWELGWEKPLEEETEQRWSVGEDSYRPTSLHRRRRVVQITVGFADLPRKRVVYDRRHGELVELGLDSDVKDAPASAFRADVIDGDLATRTLFVEHEDGMLCGAVAEVASHLDAPEAYPLSRLSAVAEALLSHIPAADRNLYEFGGEDVLEPVDQWRAAASYDAELAWCERVGREFDDGEERRIEEESEDEDTVVVEELPPPPLQRPKCGMLGAEPVRVLTGARAAPKAWPLTRSLASGRDAWPAERLADYAFDAGKKSVKVYVRVPFAVTDECVYAEFDDELRLEVVDAAASTRYYFRVALAHAVSKQHCKAAAKRGDVVVTLRKADPEDAWLTLASTEVAGNYF